MRPEIGLYTLSFFIQLIVSGVCSTTDRGLFKSNLAKCLSCATWDFSFCIVITILIFMRVLVGRIWVAAKGHYIKKCWLTAWWFG